MHDFDLLAVRHGRTAWNAGGRFQGQTDVPLDEAGRDQARRLGRAIAAIPVTRAVSSDLGRAAETAELALAGRGIPIARDAGWREMQFGAWEGLTWSEIAERYPEAAARRGAFPTPTDGESFGALTERIRAAFERLRGAAIAGETVLVATHAGPLHALLRVALGESEAAALAVRFEPATYTHLAFRGARAELVALNVSSPDDAATAAP